MQLCGGLFGFPGYWLRHIACKWCTTALMFTWYQHVQPFKFQIRARAPVICVSPAVAALL
jgi:hypothetical protein